MLVPPLMRFGSSVLASAVMSLAKAMTSLPPVVGAAPSTVDAGAGGAAPEHATDTTSNTPTTVGTHRALFSTVTSAPSPPRGEHYGPVTVRKFCHHRSLDRAGQFTARGPDWGLRCAGHPPTLLP